MQSINRSAWSEDRPCSPPDDRPCRTGLGVYAGGRARGSFLNHPGPAIRHVRRVCDHPRSQTAKRRKPSLVGREHTDRSTPPREAGRTHAVRASEEREDTLLHPRSALANDISGSRAQAIPPPRHPSTTRAHTARGRKTPSRQGPFFFFRPPQCPHATPPQIGMDGASTIGLEDARRRSQRSGTAEQNGLAKTPPSYSNHSRPRPSRTWCSPRKTCIFDQVLYNKRTPTRHSSFTVGHQCDRLQRMVTAPNRVVVVMPFCREIGRRLLERSDKGLGTLPVRTALTTSSQADIERRFSDKSVRHGIARRAPIGLCSIYGESS